MRPRRDDGHLTYSTVFDRLPITRIFLNVPAAVLAEHGSVDPRDAIGIKLTRRVDGRDQAPSARPRNTAARAARAEQNSRHKRSNGVPHGFHEWGRQAGPRRFPQ